MTPEELTARAKALEVLLKTLELRQTLFSGHPKDYSIVQQAVLRESVLLAQQLQATAPGGFSQHAVALTQTSQVSTTTTPGYYPSSASGAVGYRSY